MNSRILMIVASLGLAPLVSASAAFATPLISSCSANSDGVTQTCNFYETDANGSPSEISSPVSNLFSATSYWLPGYSAIDDPNGTLSDIIVWAAVPGTDVAQSGTLYSCDDGQLANNCDTTGLAYLGTGFEDANGDLLLAGKTRHLFGSEATAADTLNVYSPTEVPEPMSISLFGAGLAGAFAMRRRRKSDKAV